MKAQFSRTTRHHWRRVVLPLCLCICLWVCGCHPARQIQKQDDAIDQLKAKWIGEWVLSHPCPPLPEMNLDSLCALYGKGDPTDFAFQLEDSVRSDSTGKVIHDTIRRSVLQPPQRILVPWEDTRRINLLLDSLRSRQAQIAALQEGMSVKAQDCSAEVEAARKEKTKWIWLFIAACAVIAGGGAWGLFELFHRT